MSKYTIFFGKEPEELEFGGWKDSLNLSDADEVASQVAGKFETESIDLLWSMLFSLRDNPPAMWYWVYEGENLLMSGAIDPDDVYALVDVLPQPGLCRN